MKGKERCKILKEIRQKIAEENDIEYIVSECTHKGECRGTCPKCEAELRYLERELERRQRMGKTIAVVGLAASLTFGTAGCVDPFAGKELGGDPLPPTDPGGKAKIEELAGDMPAPLSIASFAGLRVSKIVTDIMNSGFNREMLRVEWADARMTGGETCDRYVIPDDGRVICISEVDGKLVVAVEGDFFELHDGEPAPGLPPIDSLAGCSAEEIEEIVKNCWMTKEMIRSEWADILVSEDDTCDQYRLEDGRVILIREEEGQLFVEVKDD